MPCARWFRMGLPIRVSRLLCSAEGRLRRLEVWPRLRNGLHYASETRTVRVLRQLFDSPRTDLYSGSCRADFCACHRREDNLPRD